MAHGAVHILMLGWASNPESMPTALDSHLKQQQETPCTLTGGVGCGESMGKVYYKIHFA